MSGKQIKLFLVDGTPGGRHDRRDHQLDRPCPVSTPLRSGRLAETGRGQRTGVYFLLGDDESALGDTRCYIGEADVVADRLRHHNRDSNKDFWDRVVLVTSKDTNLTKSHGRYLESRLISLAKQAARVTLENSTAPPVPALPEADASDMDYFLSQLQIVLPVLGVNAIRVRPTKAPSAAVADSTESPVFRLRQAKLGVDAQAQQVDGEFTVLAGSTVVASWHGVGKADSTMKSYASYRAHHERLVGDGSIVVETGRGRVTRDLVFTSPSTAGAVALGRSCNGRREWIAGSETFGDWETRGVE